MDIGLRALIEDNRQENVFLPAAGFGYIYTEYANLSVCSFNLPQTSDFTFTGFSSVVYLALAGIALVASSVMYRLGGDDQATKQIRKQIRKGLFGYSLTTISILNWLFLSITPFILCLRVCHGNLVVNGLLFIPGRDPAHVLGFHSPVCTYPRQVDTLADHSPVLKQAPSINSVGCATPGRNNDRHHADQQTLTEGVTERFTHPTLSCSCLEYKPSIVLASEAESRVGIRSGVTKHHDNYSVTPTTLTSCSNVEVLNAGEKVYFNPAGWNKKGRMYEPMVISDDSLINFNEISCRSSKERQIGRKARC